MPEALWYYAQDDEQKGPVSAAELRQLASSGRIGPQNLVWKEGMEDWAPAAKIKGLFPDGQKQADQPKHAESPKQVEHQKQPAQTTPAPRPVEEPAANDSPDFAAMAASPAVATEPADEEDEPAEQPRKARTTEREPAAKKPAVKKLAARAPAAPDPGRSLAATLQICLWSACGIVVLLGGILLVVVLFRAKDSTAQGGACAIFGAIFLGSYVLARAGDRIVEILTSKRD